MIKYEVRDKKTGGLYGVEFSILGVNYLIKLLRLNHENVSVKRLEK